MPKKSSSINWKTVLASIALIGIGSAWAVTAKMTETNAGDIKETKGDVDDLKVIVTKQQMLSNQQYSINKNLVKILGNKNESGISWKRKKMRHKRNGRTH